jgi:multimeric flavodoxin WrbA
MKVLLINGSPHKKGSTSIALNEVSTTLEKEGLETETICLGNTAIRDCTGCFTCLNKNLGKCVFDDDIVNKIIEKAKTCDGFIFGTPVYYAHPTGMILSLLDRVFFAGNAEFAFKPAAGIAVARRSGTTASFDVMNKYFSHYNMPIVSSQYWNNAHGRGPEDVPKDLEGMQTMRTLAKNMAWLLKCIEIGKQNGINKPELEQRISTNFINNNIE